MSETRLLDVAMLYLLWLLPLLVALILYAGWRRRQALERFAEPALLPQLSATLDHSRRRWKSFLLLAAFAFAVVALARPAWNPVEEQVQRRGRDVVFLLDVSKSMLAEDLAPNRLGRAKLAILDAVDRIQGDRVALVVFAGTAVVKCPPTYDYGFFRMAVQDVSVNSVSRGGTLIGDAIRTTISQVLTDSTRGHRDLVLITDGEDHESVPLEAARQLGQMGVRLIAIGLGDENQGRRIPITGADGRRHFLQYQGREVWSRLDAETLRKMVNETPGGRYLNVATGTIDFGDVYLKLIASAEQTDLGTARFRHYEEKYQIFLTVAFLLLCFEIAMRERKRAARMMVLLLVVWAGGGAAWAQSARSLVTEGNKAYHDQRFPDALDHYKKAEGAKPDAPQIWFDKGDALYQQGDYAGASDAFEQAAVHSDNSRLQALSKYNQGNATFQTARHEAQQDPQQAIRTMEKAVQLYHDSLDADPSFSAARHNIEVAKRAIAEIRQMPPPPQSNKQKQNDKQKQDQQSQQQQQASNNQQQKDKNQQQKDQQGKDQQQQQQQNQQQQQQQAANKPNEDPRKIIDKEREDRLQRNLNAAVAGVPVDKDW